jgi:S-disulfanyl-L-cysteine oxidoreductase SoxD
MRSGLATPMLLVVMGMLAAVSLAGVQAPASPARSQWSGIYSVAQAQRGEALYAENCAFCHGADLGGTNSAPPLTRAALSAKWQGRSLGELFDYQQIFMPMNSPGGFSRAQNAEILAFVFKAGGLPAGSTDLPSAPDLLKKIVVAANKP